MNRSNVPVRLSYLALLLILTSCGLRIFSEKEAVVLPSRDQECLDQVTELETQVQAGATIEATRLDLGRLFSSIDSDCATQDRFFGMVLQKARKSTSLIAALGYAVYGRDLLTASEEGDGWKLEVWKDEVRKKMLERADRLRRLSRRGRIPEGLYDEYLSTMLGFAAWHFDSHWRTPRPAEYRSVDPSEIRVEDLDFLSHSVSTLMLYYQRYADHDILGNLRNFEAMRTHLDRLITREDEVCPLAESLSGSGLFILPLESPLQIQTALEKTTGPQTARTTSSPSFLRAGDSDRSAANLLIRVPRNDEEPFQVWPSGVVYLLKPLPGGHKGLRILEARIRWPEEENISPRLRVLRLLGKAPPVRPELITVSLTNPRRFRMVAYMDGEVFRGMEEKCGVSVPTVSGVP